MSKLRIAVSVFCFLVCFANAWGQNDDCKIRHLRVLETDNYFDVVDPEGVVFPPRANSVLRLDRPVPGAGTIVLIPPGGRLEDSGTLTLEISDPINITFDPRTNRLFLFERESSELVIIHLRRLVRNRSAVQRFKADAFGVMDPGGMAVDPKTGTLFILDRVGPKIVQVDPGPNRKNYQHAAARAGKCISQLFLQQSQPFELRGLGFNYGDGSLYAFSPTTQELYKVTEDGALISVGDFSGFDRIEPKGLVFMHSLDQTDDPKKVNLYIASGRDRQGQVSEWSLTPCNQHNAR